MPASMRESASNSSSRPANSKRWRLRGRLPFNSASTLEASNSLATYETLDFSEGICWLDLEAKPLAARELDEEQHCSEGWCLKY